METSSAGAAHLFVRQQECPPVVNHVSFIWNIAESLRGPFKPSEYGSVVLPFIPTFIDDLFNDSGIFAELSKALPAMLYECFKGQTT
tara:strand:+ start:488 stop:748 length:261 start_codon:yes stop_codon:yes gene_type:complete